MRTLLSAALASFVATALLPASAGAQESACAVYCEQVPSGGGNTNTGGNGSNQGGTSINTGGGGTNPGDAATGGPTEQEPADDTSWDSALSEGERGQGGDSAGQVEDDAESITALGGNSGGDSGIGIGLPVLLALVLLGAIGFTMFSRSDPASP